MISSAKIHIIGGTGQMGSWLKNFLASQKIPVGVSGSKGVADSVLKNADLIFISVPISKSPALILDLSKKVRKSTVLIDLSSVGRSSFQALKQTDQPASGVHFLFGPKVTSIQNQKVIFIKIKSHPLINELKDLLKKEGAIIYEMGSREHDFYMAHIQNLIHFLNLSLAKILIEDKIGLSGKISTPNLLAQLAVLSSTISQPPELISEIQLENKLGVEVITKFLTVQERLLELVKQKNRGELEKELISLHQQIDSTPHTRVSDSKLKPSNIRIKAKLGFLGPEGTFSNQAALLVSSKKNLVALESINQIFDMVSEGWVEFGIVPAENTTEGTVRETLDFLMEFNLKVNGSVDLPIHQNLLSDEKVLSDIKIIYSHPQALGQCRNWLKFNLPGVKLQSAPSTVASIVSKRKEKGVAFIAPVLAAKLNNIQILKANIEDSSANQTRFYIISKNPKSLIETSRTLLFLTIFNRVGILRDILDVFASLNINLSKIESRPSREKMWDYHFFIEVEKPLDSQELSEALNILKQFCPVIKVLGGI